MQSINKTRHNEYARVIIAIALAVCLLVGLFFGLQLSVRVVESGSMCIPYGRLCEGWLSLNHTFTGTLHKGDIIIVQHVNPEDLNVDYPSSDTIAYTKPTHLDETPIVHRIVTCYEKNGTLYFETKGDGNGDKWPAIPTEEQYDSRAFWDTGEGVPADLVKGKVILRIPCLGWITLLLKGIYGDHPWILPLIILLIVLLVVVEYVRPLIKRKKNFTERLKTKR